MSLPSSKKTTVPVETPPSSDDTTAVKVTFCPWIDGFREEEIAIFVLARAMSSLAGLFARLMIPGSGLVVQGSGLGPAGSYAASIE